MVSTVMKSWSERAARGLLCTALVMPALAGAQQQKQQQKVNAPALVTADAQKKSLSVVKLLEGQDLDGDAKPDVAAVLRNENEELLLGLWKVDQGKVAAVWVGNTTGAQELLDVQLKNICGDKLVELVVELREKSPDETRRVLKVLRWDGKGMRDALNLSYQEQEEEKRPDVTSYGDASGGFRLEDLDGDGALEAIIRREPKTITAQGHNDETVTLVVGVRESVFSFDVKKGLYVEKPDRNINFIPSLRLKKVSASSQQLPPELKQAEQDRALEQSFDLALEEQGPDAGPLNDDPKPVEVNPAPKAFWATDNKLDTAWVEDHKGTGEGEWLQADLKEPAELKMIRVVPVCAKDENDTRNSNDIQAMDFVLSGGGRISVDRKEKSPTSPQVVAVLEVAQPDRKFAPQVLVFLGKGVRTESVRLVLDRVKKRGRFNDACIAEFSLH